MRKVTLPERPNWRDLALDAGFNYADEDGEQYWDESSAYEFTSEEIEQRIASPANDLHAMCREAVAEIVTSEELLEKLDIPAEHRDLVAASWRVEHPEIYGRFDFLYDGSGPPKLLEYNADTPTSLPETASFQKAWLDECIAVGVLSSGDTQFNGIHDALVARFAEVFRPGSDLHFTAVGGVDEDYATAEYMGWTAREAGLTAHFTELSQIGLSTEGQFIDDRDRVIGTLFKLYPWEDLLRDDYAENIAGSNCLMLEPAWKAVLSNKGLLPVLWQMYEGHPNLLPAFFESDVRDALLGSGSGPKLFQRSSDAFAKGYIRKPLFSREGASMAIIEGGEVSEMSIEDDYAEHPQVLQAFAPPVAFDGFHPVMGAWVVGHSCVGLGIREDQSRITQHSARFKPHYIRD